MDDSIELHLEECPLAYVTDDIWELIQLAGLYEKGLPPISGGSLDQAHIFVEACRIIWAEQSFWKRKFKLYD